MIHGAHCNHSYNQIANHSFGSLCNSGYMETISDRIKRLRSAKEMSQQAVADAVGVSRVAVTKWESGQTENLKLDNLARLRRLFSVSFDELITGNAAPYPAASEKPLNHCNEPFFVYSTSAPQTPDEAELIRGYRVASDDVRKLMLMAATNANEQRDFSKRSSTQ